MVSAVPGISKQLLFAARLSLITATGAAVAMIAAAPSAHAGEYHVYSCRTPTGQSAPVDGWSGSTTGTSYTYAEDTCSQPGGALVAALGEAPREANSDVATWAFGSPAGESIAGATLWRAGDADGGAGRFQAARG